MAGVYIVVHVLCHAVVDAELGGGEFGELFLRCRSFLRRLGCCRRLLGLCVCHCRVADMLFEV